MGKTFYLDVNEYKWYFSPFIPARTVLENAGRIFRVLPATAPRLLADLIRLPGFPTKFLKRCTTRMQLKLVPGMDAKVPFRIEDHAGEIRNQVEAC